MTQQVRMVPSPELGEPQPETLVLFGQAVGRDYTKVDYNDDQLAKVRGNRFFQVKGDPLDHDGNGKKGGSVKAGSPVGSHNLPPPEPVVPDDAAELDATRARLDELEVPYDGRLGLDKLKPILAEAEAQAAKA